MLALQAEIDFHQSRVAERDHTINQHLARIQQLEQQVVEGVATRDRLHENYHEAERHRQALAIEAANLTATLQQVRADHDARLGDLNTARHERDAYLRQGERQVRENDDLRENNLRLNRIVLQREQEIRALTAQLDAAHQASELYKRRADAAAITDRPGYRRARITEFQVTGLPGLQCPTCKLFFSPGMLPEHAWQCKCDQSWLCDILIKPAEAPATPTEEPHAPA